MESNDGERGERTWVSVEEVKGMGEWLPQTMPSALVSQVVESPRRDAWHGEDEWAA